MKKSLLYSLIFVLGILITVGVFKASDFLYQRQTNNITAPEVKKAEENEFILSKDVSASIVWWDQENGLLSAQQNKDKVNYIHPVWYKVKKDGSIKRFTGAGDEKNIQFAQQNKIKLMPAIVNDCEAYEVEELLKDDSLIDKHIQNILALVKDNGFDGIEVNYECLGGQNVRPKYSEFIGKLSEQLHAEKKLLSTSVHAKNSEYGTWEGPATQDFKLLSEKCDKIKLMTYDYHWSTSEAGDIAPVSWMEEMLAFAVSQIEPKKLHLGIHFYGYDWVEKSAKDLTYTDVKELIERFGPEIKTSTESEKYFTYTLDEAAHTVYFADSETISKRLELVKKYNIAGIGIWRLGQEDEKNWETISSSFKK